MSAPQTVTCPRCGRIGRVSPDPRVAGWHQVNWPPRAESREYSARKSDKDTGLDLADLHDPELGCGYDGGPEDDNDCGDPEVSGLRRLLNPREPR